MINNKPTNFHIDTGAEMTVIYTRACPEILGQTTPAAFWLTSEVPRHSLSTSEMNDDSSSQESLTTSQDTYLRSERIIQISTQTASYRATTSHPANRSGEQSVFRLTHRVSRVVHWTSEIGRRLHNTAEGRNETICTFYPLQSRCPTLRCSEGGTSTLGVISRTTDWCSGMVVVLRAMESLHLCRLDKTE